MEVKKIEKISELETNNSILKIQQNNSGYFLDSKNVRFNNILDIARKVAANDSNVNYVLISYLVIPVFWLLDGFFISTERQYRDIYNEVCAKKEDEIDFSMNAEKFNSGRNTWLSGVFSKTLIPFYGISIIVTIIVIFLITGR